MKIDRAEVNRIAALAHLEFDSAGVERMARELSAIIDYIDQLSEVETNIRSEESTISTPLREDQVRLSTPLEAIVPNAPKFERGFFVVPRVIGSE